jgi:nitrite reductase/ring-hydroxylating ferredoxin subunit
MGFVKALSKSQLEEGRSIGVEVGGKEILIANVGGNFYAIGNRCTHMGCMLSDGHLKGDSIVCSCHGTTFDIKTGAIIKGPGVKAESKFDVKVEEDQILVNV